MKKAACFITIFFYGLSICYSQPGQPNPSFGSNGIIINYVPVQYSEFGSLAVSNGKIVVMGGSLNTDHTIYRYKLNGTRDSTFGTNGAQPANFAGSISAIQPDGKIVTVGANFISRYHADGKPDTNFNGHNGQRVIDTVSKRVTVSAVAIQGDGKILAAGVIYSGGRYGLGIYRFNNDGSVDKSFSGDGRQKTAFDTIYNVPSILLQTDGKIITGGESHLVRYNTDGSLDNAFGVNGIIKIDFAFNRMALQSDGKLVIIGTSGNEGYLAEFAVVRFNINGSKDTTFNSSGKQILQFPDEGAQYPTVAIQGDGKILVAGNISHKGKKKIVLARYNTNGSLDSVFGYEGIQQTTGLADATIDTIFGQGGIYKTAGLAEYECGDFVIVNNRAYLSARRLETIGSNLYTQGMLLSYLLAESTSTAIQFTEPKYDHAFYTDPANINITAKITHPSPGTSTKKVDFYKNSSLMFTDHTSPYNYQLKNVHKGTFSITARATDNNGMVTTSTIVPVAVLPGEPPYVYLNTPIYKQKPFIYPRRILAPADVTFPATAYDPDPDGTISKVQFYDGAKLIYTDTASPYAFIWNNVPVGQHSVNVRAIDNSGHLAAYLYPFTFTVDSIIEPSVNITAPFDNQYFDGPLATVNIVAEANPQYAGGSIIKVEFYNGATLLNTDSIYPYTFTWSSVPLGTYLLTAKATNSLGVAATSAAVRIFVVVGQSPVVKITSPAKDTNVITPGPVLLTAEAGDPYTFIKSVAFYSDSTLLFTENVAPYSRLWESVPTGSYHITAVATNIHGLKTTSAPVHITVVHNRPPVVNITSPVNGATYVAPATVVVNANALAHGVKIKMVEFYNGPTLIFTKKNYPYSFTWDSVAIGTYTLTAKATDIVERTTISAPVSITVASPGLSLFSKKPSSMENRTGINDGLRLTLLPNPARSILNINTTGLQQAKPSFIYLISPLGVIVKTIQISNPIAAGSDSHRVTQTIRLNVSLLTSGMYIIKFTSGDKVTYKQFVKM